MSLINITDLTFAYDGSYDNIFENVSFQIDSDWKLGFVGRNGRGKTTFLNLLMGKYSYNGKIQTNLRFEYFPYKAADKSLDTIDAIHSICSGSMDWEINRELSILNVSDDVLRRPFNTLSNGEQTKVLLGALFLLSNAFLLIDEPTNHLDNEARLAVSKYLKSKRGFILVSHDRKLLDDCCDHILSVNKTNIEVQKGNFSSYMENKKLQDEFELAKNEKLKKDIKRLAESANQKSKWSADVEKTKNGTRIAGLRVDRGRVGHKSAKMMKRAKNIEQRQHEAVSEKSKLLKNIESQSELKISPLLFHSNLLIDAKNLSLYYDRRQAVNNLNLTVNTGDRIALSGKNGCGKSSVLKLICGEKINYTGELFIASGLKISYISQDPSALCGSLSDFTNINDVDETLFKTILRKLDFSRTMFEKDISEFSAGQKKKVLLAKSLCENANIYIWDEPLNYIDVFSRVQIEDVILKYAPTLLFVEHDSTFCEKVSTKTVKI